MTGHLLPADTLAVLRRSYFNLTHVTERQASGIRRPYEELERGLVAAVEALGQSLAHIEAVEEDDQSDLAYAGLNYVDKWERWHDTPDDRAAFDAMHDAQVALRDAAVFYSTGVGE